MRDTSTWYKEIYEPLKKDLKNHVDDAKEIERLAQMIIHVELGLTLLYHVAANEPALTVRYLLSGYRFPAIESEEKWQKICKSRFYLLRYKGQVWEEVLEEYINLSNDLKLYDLSAPTDTPQLTQKYQTRFNIYQKTIDQTPPHQVKNLKIAEEGTWLADISYNGENDSIPINIPEEIINVLPRNRQVNFLRTRNHKNESVTVNLDDLLLTAKEMDDILAAKNIHDDYYGRLSKISLHIYQDQDFREGKNFTLDKIIHIVGLLNVGKSTILKVLTYHFAKQGKRTALIVNDVVESVKLASLFKHKLGICAAPILGSDRPTHLQKVYGSLDENIGEELTQGGTDQILEWFSVQCPLMSYVSQEKTWDFGKEPCHKLYQKDQNKPKNLNTTCPFYYSCPRHQLERDISQSYVWVLTPASFIHTRVSSMLFDEQMRFAEAVYRYCDFFFVDEADRVQIQFDEHFAPSETLISSPDAFINKVMVKIADLNKYKRSHLSSNLNLKLESAHYYLNLGVNNVYNLLSNEQGLVKWLGKMPFYGSAIFVRILRGILLGDDETNISETENIEIKNKIKSSLKQIEGFLSDPLDRKQGQELTDLANYLLVKNFNQQTKKDVEEWAKNWFKNNNIQVEKWELLTEKICFAIYLTVLEHHLKLLVDYLNRVENDTFNNISYSLVHRPPLDFLPVIPDSPVGNLLGFIYKQDENNKGGDLSYFRYVGVGRYLLLNFSELFAVDQWDSPHTILISGTSYAPDSPAYNIKIKPTVLLKNKTSDQYIHESEFRFTPQFYQQGKAQGTVINISGKQGKYREKAIADLAQKICQKNDLLQDIFTNLREQHQENPELWEDRERILTIVGSYDEAEIAANQIEKQAIGLLKPDQIARLIPDTSDDYEIGIRRGKIQESIKELKLLTAPLLALERGHNILNDNKKAAFGAIIFLIRSMPVPDDFQTNVRQLNFWALSDLNYSETTIYDQGQEFVETAKKTLKEMVSKTGTYKNLDHESRQILCANTAVTMWQIIGRGVRGEVPIQVYFVDGKFAPKSAEDSEKSEKDNENSSLIVGIIKVLESWLNAKEIYERTLAKELYQIFFNCLQNMRGLDYDR